MLAGDYLPLSARVIALRNNAITSETLEQLTLAARRGVEVEVPSPVAFILFELVAIFVVKGEGTFNLHPLSTWLTLLYAPTHTLQQSKISELVKVGTGSFVTKLVADGSEGFTTPDNWKSKLSGAIATNLEVKLLVPRGGDRGRGGRGGGDRGGGDRGGTRAVTCFNCQQEGHYARNCSFPQRSRGGVGGGGGNAGGATALKTTPLVGSGRHLRTCTDSVCPGC